VVFEVRQALHPDPELEDPDEPREDF
jgi:hypothetical protein